MHNIPTLQEVLKQSH